MRAVALRLAPERGWFGSFHRRIVETDDVSLEAVHALRLLDDGSSVLLYEYTGNPAAAERVAVAHLGADGVDWQVGDRGGRQLMFAHVEPSDLVRTVLSVLDERPVIVDWPVRFRDDRTLALTLVGDGAELQRVVDRAPEELRVRVERTGEYRPDADRLVAALTPRERETLRVAVDLGYYRNPREARYDDVAAALDCTAGTVGHHLRNAETKVMGAVLSRAGADGDAWPDA